MFTSVLGVKTIRVTGAVNAPRIIEASGIHQGRSLLRLSNSDIARRVAALPEVASVNVKKVWPKTVSIAVEIREPVALIVGPTNAALIAGNGFVIQSIPSDQIVGLAVPTLENVPPASVGNAVSGAALDLVKATIALGPLAKPLASRARIDNPTLNGGSIVFELRADPARSRKAGVVVTFGSLLDLDLKSRALESMLQSSLLNGAAPNDFGTIDLSVPDSPVLGKRVTTLARQSPVPQSGQR
jgi:cell division protein FtsQ